MQEVTGRIATVLSRTATSLIVGAFVALPVVRADNADVIDESLEGLSSPFAAEREHAARLLVEHEGNIGPRLRLYYEESGDANRLELIEVARRRKDNALVLQAARALTDQDGQLRDCAREYLFDVGPQPVETEKLEPAQYTAYQEFLHYARRRLAAGELIDSLAKPGRSIAQFEGLREKYPAFFDADMLAMLSLEDHMARPLAHATASRLALVTPNEIRRNIVWRRLAACDYFEMVMPWLREGYPDPTMRTRLRNQAEGLLLATVSVLQDLRAAAARALAVSTTNIVLPEQMLEIYRNLEVEPADPYLRRVAEPVRIQVEIEIALSRFGRPELLNDRISGLRRLAFRGQSAEASAPIRAVSDTEFRIRNDIAYLLLRNGSYSEAETEWQRMIDDLKAAQPLATVRQRGTLAAMLAGFYYNLSCAQSLQLKAETGLENLKSSVEAGYGDFEWMLEDSDLDHVRALPAFRQWFSDRAPPSVVDRFISR